MSDGLTPTRLDEIVAAAKAATPGPWVAEYGGGEEVVLPSDALSTLEAVCVTKLFHRQADAKHIAGLSPDVSLALVAEVRELRAKVEKVQGIIGPRDLLDPHQGGCEGLADETLLSILDTLGEEA